MFRVAAAVCSATICILYRCLLSFGHSGVLRYNLHHIYVFVVIWSQRCARGCKVTNSLPAGIYWNRSLWYLPDITRISIGCRCCYLLLSIAIYCYLLLSIAIYQNIYSDICMLSIAIYCYLWKSLEKFVLISICYLLLSIAIYCYLLLSIAIYRISIGYLLDIYQISIRYLSDIYRIFFGYLLDICPISLGKAYMLKSSLQHPLFLVENFLAALAVQNPRHCTSHVCAVDPWDAGWHFVSLRQVRHGL